MLLPTSPPKKKRVGCVRLGVNEDSEHKRNAEIAHKDHSPRVHIARHIQGLRSVRNRNLQVVNEDSEHKRNAVDARDMRSLYDELYLFE
jgi:hypothetical protein